MAALFSDLPDAVANTLLIARRCAFADRDGQADAAAPTTAAPAGRKRRRWRARRAVASTSGWRDAGRLAAAEQTAYRERLDYELDVICKMGFAGYFLIVAEFIRWAKEQRHSGRTRARLRRRLGGRLGAGDHRPRSAALRAAVRALPQSGTGVDAGLRHRLLPGPARRGDPPRAGEVRRTTASAQIITFGKLQARAVLRDVGRVLGTALRTGRHDLQAGPQQPGQSGDARSGDRQANRRCRRWSQRTRRWRS